MSTTTRTVIKSLLLNSRSEVLVLKRTEDDETRPGMWDLPGGSVEENEEFRTAIAREIAEETGIEIAKAELELVYAKTSMREDKNLLAICFTHTFKEDVSIIISPEHTEFRWVSLNEAYEMLKDCRWGEALGYLLENSILKTQ